MTSELFFDEKSCWISHFLTDEYDFFDWKGLRNFPFHQYAQKLFINENYFEIYGDMSLIKNIEPSELLNAFNPRGSGYELDKRRFYCHDEIVLKLPPLSQIFVHNLCSPETAAYVYENFSPNTAVYTAMLSNEHAPQEAINKVFKSKKMSYRKVLSLLSNKNLSPQLVTEIFVKLFTVNPDINGEYDYNSPKLYDFGDYCMILKYMVSNPNIPAPLINFIFSQLDNSWDFAYLVNRETIIDKIDEKYYSLIFSYNRLNKNIYDFLTVLNSENLSEKFDRFQKKDRVQQIVLFIKHFRANRNFYFTLQQFLDLKSDVFKEDYLTAESSYNQVPGFDYLFKYSTTVEGAARIISKIDDVPVRKNFLSYLGARKYSEGYGFFLEDTDPQISFEASMLMMEVLAE